jgi:hypothetical protein
MNTKISIYSRVLLASAVTMLLAFRIEAATIWEKARVSILELPDPGHDCVFFTLVNVHEADPAFPGSPWIAIPASQNGFQQMYDLLLRAKLGGGGSVGVVTSGAAASSCMGLGSSQPIVGVSYLYLD